MAPVSLRSAWLMSRAWRPMNVAHLALDLGAGHERGHRVDDDQSTPPSARASRDLEGLFARVGLADEELIDIDAEPRA